MPRSEPLVWCGKPKTNRGWPGPEMRTSQAPSRAGDLLNCAARSTIVSYWRSPGAYRSTTQGQVAPGLTFFFPFSGTQGYVVDVKGNPSPKGRLRGQVVDPILSADQHLQTCRRHRASRERLPSKRSRETIFKWMDA